MHFIYTNNSFAYVKRILFQWFDIFREMGA